MRFTHIYEDADNRACLDRYFESLDDSATSMPPGLSAFARDKARYAAQGERTLHDAWLLGAIVGKGYGDAHVVASSTFELRLLQARHASEVVLRYAGVTRLNMRLHPDFWPDTPIDLLAHEVTVCGTQSFRHAFRFDRGVYIDVRFREFAVEDVARA